MRQFTFSKYLHYLISRYFKKRLYVGQNGFTLFELSAVIGILGTPAGLLMTNTTNYVSTSKSTTQKPE